MALLENHFVKYEGLGNDFVMIDNRHSEQLCFTPAEAVAICDRRFGVGADGVIFLLPSKTADFGMRLLNSDGSEAEMCGNGIRCLAQFALELGIEAPTGVFKVETQAGAMAVTLQDALFSVDMGPPFLLAGQIPTTLAPADQKVIDMAIDVAAQTWHVTCVSMGNPHAVLFVPDVEAIDLHRLGPIFENLSVFPQRTNTHFVQVIDRTHLKMRIWERGAGPTLACGTGACAVLVAAVLNNLCETSATVELPGGPLSITWESTTNHLRMTGPAKRVFAGQLSLSVG